ncbi:MAG: amino acid ABC transporter permease [Treponema sp.]|nr:amino acid ABC transporter permease [Treponema sp.]
MTGEKLLLMLKNMAEGTVVSIEVFFLTLLFAIPLAIFLCAGRRSKINFVRWIFTGFILIIRGTPLMLQLICVYFIPGQIFGASLDRFVAAVVALAINYACYFAEIYRGGIEAIPVGQYEASKVLGLSKIQTFFHIVMPQVIKRIMPAMGNEVITLVKDTALVQVIGVVELLHVSKTTSSRMFSTVPLFVAGIFYFVMNGVVSFIFSRIEKKLDYYK